MTSDNVIEHLPSRTSCRITPPGFDVTTASQEELAVYRIPPRPDPRRAPTEFQMWSTAFKRDFKLIKPELRASSRRHGPIQGLDLGSSTDLNWAGAVITNFAPLSAVSVAAQWQVQWVWPAGGFPEVLATWVGMDGFDNTDVLQAGVDQIFEDPTEIIMLWYEWYPADSVEITNLPVNHGDTVTCLVTANDGAHASVFFSINGTIGTSIDFQIPDGAQFFGSSAEFIAERPSLGGNLVDLPAYTDVVLTQINATLSDGVTVNLAQNPILVTMTDGAGNVLAVPSMVNPGTVAVAPPVPVKTFEKHPDKNGEKGHHVIENLPVLSAPEYRTTESDTVHETFIKKQDRPLEGA
jgi:hypothetical protein